MAQVLKAEVRDRIADAALRRFAEQGYERTTLARIAADAGTAVANVYRYFPNKEALLAAVVPPDLAERHDALLDTRVAALSGGDPGPAAADLLAFWTEHRLALVVLLARAEGTPYADYPDAFVDRMVRHLRSALPGPPTPAQDTVLRLVFDNTRRAVAHLLLTAADGDELAEMVGAFWSYQVPGLDGFLAGLRRRT